MALSTYDKTFVHGTLKLGDGTGTPVVMTLDTDKGTFKVGPLKEKLNETVKSERRGKFRSASPGTRIYPTGSFEAKVAQFTDATAAVVTDFVLKNNKYSANVSTLGANAQVYAIDITLTLEGTDFGDSADHEFVMTDCVVTLDEFAEGEEDLVSFSFEVLGAITGDLACSEIS